MLTVNPFSSQSGLVKMSSVRQLQPLPLQEALRILLYLHRVTFHHRQQDSNDTTPRFSLLNMVLVLALKMSMTSESSQISYQQMYEVLEERSDDLW